MIAKNDQVNRSDLKRSFSLALKYFETIPYAQLENHSIHYQKQGELRHMDGQMDANSTYTVNAAEDLLGT